MGLFHNRPSRPRLQLYNTHGMDEATQRALRVIILAGMFGNAFGIITTSAAWTGFLRMLGANAMQLGIISAIPVAASVSQILASYLLESRMERRTMLIVFGFIQRLGWIVIAFIPLLFPQTAGDMRLYALMMLLAAVACGGCFLNIGYYSLVGDVVPPRIRGQYFSVRQVAITAAGIVAGLLVALLVDSAEGFGGYVAALAIAGAVGSLDICCFFFMKWPPMQRKKREKDDPGFFSMLLDVLKNREYMRIVAYFTAWFFAVNLITPFVNVYLLEEIRMSYAQIALYNQIVPNAATLLIVAWWGRQMDRFGNQPVVQTVGLYCMLIPLTFIFITPHSFWLLPVANVFNGMTFPASDLGQQNMYLAKAPAKNRTMYVAIFLTSTQLLGTALSSVVSGALMDGLFVTLETKALTVGSMALDRYDYLFALSSALRCLCVLGLLPLLRESGDTHAVRMVTTLAREAREDIRRRRLAARAARIRRAYRRQNGG